MRTPLRLLCLLVTQFALGSCSYGADRGLETWPDDPTPQPERDENGVVIDGG
jgi:hypothetical protein